MRPLSLLALLAAASLTTVGAAGAQQHYDCSQPGNAAQPACKSASGGASPHAAKAAAIRNAKATSDKPAVTPKAAPDTSSPSAGGSGKVVSFKQANGKVVHYDCTKPGNATKQACKH